MNKKLYLLNVKVDLGPKGYSYYVNSFTEFNREDRFNIKSDRILFQIDSILKIVSIPNSKKGLKLSKKIINLEKKIDKLNKTNFLNYNFFQIRDYKKEIINLFNENFSSKLMEYDSKLVSNGFLLANGQNIFTLSTYNYKKNLILFESGFKYPFRKNLDYENYDILNFVSFT